MLQPSSYKNYVTNNYYYLGQFAYSLAKKLDYGRCDEEKFSRDMRIIRALFKIISCYDYPIELEVESSNITSNDDEGVVITSVPTQFNYIVNWTGLDAIIDGSVYKILGFDSYLSKIYLKDFTATTISSMYIQNNRENCITTEQFRQVVDTLNEILGTNYCVPVDLDYTV